MAEYLANGWNWVWLLCGYIGMGFIRWYELLILALAKECLDQLALYTGWFVRWGLDPAGFCIWDIVMCGIGMLVYKIIKGNYQWK